MKNSLVRKIITTADGSKSIQIEAWNEQYHSVHGAIQEAVHVYIAQGLVFWLDHRKINQAQTSETDSFNAIEKVDVLEIGFGTGLNAFLTLLQANKRQVETRYVAVEAFPITPAELAALNYPEQLQAKEQSPLFQTMHAVPWEVETRLTPYFTLQKQQKYFEAITAKDEFDLIYFDAFGARVQPELWSESIFKLMYEALHDTGVLVTYAAKGSVRRAMQAVGFVVEKLPGPPGKREMLRALKTPLKRNAIP